jgi:TetR/AcrR family transcriptional regulator, ethionamide resistance regulator
MLPLVNPVIPFRSMTSESAIRQVRDRRRAARERSEGPRDTREEILVATERVLEQTPLAELSVERIVQEAGVTRRTFYSYFESKYEPVAQLHTRVIDDFYALVQPFLDNADGPPADATFRTMIQQSADLWHKHLAIGRAVYEHWHSEPILGDQWLEFVDRFAEAVGAQIAHQREAGLAPPGPDSRELAASLLWTTQDLMYVSTSDARPNALTEAGALQTLETIWTRAIYG